MGGEPKKPFPLLDLPDEVIAQIYELVHPGDSESDFGVPDPVDTITVNKRVYAIALPIWVRTLYFPADARADSRSGLDELYGQLYTRTQYHTFTAEIDLGHGHDMPDMRLLALKQLCNLRTLAVGIDDNTDDQADAERCVLELLRGLPNLEVLTFADMRYEARDEPFPDFRLLRDTRITELTVMNEVSISLLIGDIGSHSLDKLTIAYGDFVNAEGSVLPWVVSKRFISLVEARLEAFLPLITDLEQLTFIDCLDTLELTIADTEDEQYWPGLLRIFQLVVLRRLRLRHVRWIPLIQDGSKFKFKTVKVLEIDFKLRAANSFPLRQLRSFLGLFPSITHLTLSSVRFIAEDDDEAAIRAFGTLEYLPFLIRHTTAAALLLYIQRSTSILLLRLELTRGAALVCRRSTAAAAEEFSKDIVSASS